MLANGSLCSHFVSMSVGTVLAHSDRAACHAELLGELAWAFAGECAGEEVANFGGLSSAPGKCRHDSATAGASATVAVSGIVAAPTTASQAATPRLGVVPSHGRAGYHSRTATPRRDYSGKGATLQWR